MENSSKSTPNEYVNISSFSKLGDKPSPDLQKASINGVPSHYQYIDIYQPEGANEQLGGVNTHPSKEVGAENHITSKSVSKGCLKHQASCENFSTFSGRKSDVSSHRISKGTSLEGNISPISSPPPTPDQTVTDTKLRLLMAEKNLNNGCENCDELNHLLETWEIGVSGLARNYSRILAQLIKSRKASMALEYRLSEVSAAKDVQGKAAKLSVSPSVIPKNRQSMFVNDGLSAVTTTTIRDRDLAQNMYPERESPVRSAESSTISSHYAKELKDLNFHMGEAIDLCQRLAAASFKTNHLSSLSSKRCSSHSSISPQFKHTFSSVMHCNQKRVSGSPAGDLSFKPTLHSIAERESMRKKRHRTLERVPSAPNLEYSGDFMSSSDSHSESDFIKSFVHVYKEDIPDHVTKAVDIPDHHVSANGKEVASHVTGHGAEPVPSLEIVGGDDHTLKTSRNLPDPNMNVESENVAVSSPSGDSTSSENIKQSLGYDDRTGSILSSVSTYSDTDVKFVMSKIASLEEERFKLLETIDTLQEDNVLVRQSLREIFEDLENKDLQLTLAMQDLTIATGEINKAAEMRRKLDALSMERETLLNKLSDLEDESSAVKVSLIQLLQEKSATNKTLALENFRLAQKTSHSGDAPLPPGDNTSIHSNYSTTTEDVTLQEVYMGADMSSNYVHKQGFLVKQGGKVKSWKKRLFVLSTEGLSYYKTEQPIQTLPVEKIEKVQLCHGRCSQPNMFEVHTQGRIYYLSAPSGDEMQSWVGMLETLKQYNRAATLHRNANLRAQANIDKDNRSPVSHGSAYGESVSSPREKTPSSNDDTKVESDEEEEEQPQTLLKERVSPQLDEDDDTSYLLNFKQGTTMSMPTHLFNKGASQSDLIASLDLSNM